MLWHRRIEYDTFDYVMQHKGFQVQSAVRNGTVTLSEREENNQVLLYI